ncbi:MAG: hypothetical protein ACI9BW_001981 [Gammaproteobacteria bacterium]|jgi:hypothetical protein
MFDFNCQVGLLLLASAMLAQSAGAVTVGQSDASNTTSQGWGRGGGKGPLGPDFEEVAHENGTEGFGAGPNGASDGFALLNADGFADGGKLTAFNFAQWGGDYSSSTGTGVGRISMDVKNFGSTFNGVDVDLALTLSIGTSNFSHLAQGTSTVTLAPGGD